MIPFEFFHSTKIMISNYREFFRNFAVNNSLKMSENPPRKLFALWHPRRSRPNFQIGYYNDINHFCMEVCLNFRKIPKFTKYSVLLSAMVLSMIPTGPFYRLFCCLNTLNMSQMVFLYGLLLLYLLGVYDWLTIIFAL